MNNFLKGLLIISLLGNICLMSFLAYSSTKKNKLGYVNIQQLFDKFEFKKEMEKNVTKVQQERQQIIDSLEFELRLLNKQIQEDKDKNNIALFETKREEYYKKKQQFEEDNAAMVKKYDSQIFQHINQYIADFGKANNYRYIFGNTSDGNLMYGLEDENVTEQVSQFINKKYKGVE